VETFRLAGQIALAGLVLSALAMVFGLLTKQPWRFKVVGYTGFLVVLTAGLFALTFAPLTRPKVEGAKPYEVVFDRGRGRVVIAVAPEITSEELSLTLQQARSQLFSSGRRGGDASGKLQIVARTLVSVKSGISQVIVLGKIELPVNAPLTDGGQVTIDPTAFATLQTARTQARP